MARRLLFRAGGMVITFMLLLVLLVVVLGKTGSSDKMLTSSINEELRGVRQSLSQTVRNPKEIERIMRIRQKELEKQYGLDKHWIQRTPQDILNVLTLDFGEAKTLRSTSGSNKILNIVAERLPNTMMLMMPSFVIVTIFGLLIGVLLATHPGGKIDRVISFFSVGSNAMPAWWLSILLISVFAVMFPVLPAGGMYSAPPPEGGFLQFLDLVRHAVLPVLALTLVSLGPYLYTIRQITIKIAHEPFVTFARAQGFSEWRIRLCHILRVASPTIIIGVLSGLSATFGGAILTETVFKWPGMGRLYADALLGVPDMGIMVALTIFFSVLWMVSRFMQDWLSALLDPRIRL